MQITYKTSRRRQRHRTRDKACEIVHFDLRVVAILDAGQIEHFRAVVHIRPEALLHLLLGLPQRLDGFEGVEVREHAHDLRGMNA